MKLIKIESDHVQIKTDEYEFDDARINDLIAVSDGKVTLMTAVTSLTDTEASFPLLEDDFLKDAGHIKILDCAIIGSLKDGKYQKAIDEYPVTQIQAEAVAPDQFSSMLGDETSGFCIGEYCSYHCPAWIDGNRFFQRHACVVGNTGSGKSETLAAIMEKAAARPGANLILFDIHGEYGHISYVDNLKVGTDIDFPAWMFGFQDMASNILKIKEESATVAMAALRKCYARICPDGDEGKPFCFDYQQLIAEMCRLNTEEVPTGEVYKSGDRAGMYKTVKGELNGKLSGVIHTLEAKLHDKRYAFLLSQHSQPYLNQIIERLMGGEKPVKNIDLSEVPHDIAIPMIGAITKLIYEVQKASKQRNRPLTLVCDEAHVYIPDHYQLSASQRRMVDVFENIAKEGRKFGVTLLVASQRPSELNKTIMAQCANFIVGKLNNENDKAMVKGMMPDGNESVIDSTTMFSPGDVIIIGDAAAIPLKIHVTLAEERPKSRTVAFWDEWGRKQSLNVDDAVEQYLHP